MVRKAPPSKNLRPKPPAAKAPSKEVKSAKKPAPPTKSAPAGKPVAAAKPAPAAKAVAPTKPAAPVKAAAPAKPAKAKDAKPPKKDTKGLSAKGIAPRNADSPPKKKRAKSGGVRLKAYWGVFNQIMKRVAVFEYADRKQADKKAGELGAGGKTPHFVQLVKEVIRDAD